MPPTPTRPYNARIERQVDVRLRDADGSDHFIHAQTHTINVSEHGMLMEVPPALDACVGQEVIVSLQWGGAAYESPGEIVRFESPYWKDQTKTVMGIRLRDALPGAMLTAHDTVA